MLSFILYSTLPTQNTEVWHGSLGAREESIFETGLQKKGLKERTTSYAHRLPLVIPESYLKPHSHFPALPHLWVGGRE